jgi:glycolate oxidase
VANLSKSISAALSLKPSRGDSVEIEKSDLTSASFRSKQDAFEREQQSVSFQNKKLEMMLKELELQNKALQAKGSEKNPAGELTLELKKISDEIKEIRQNALSQKNAELKNALLEYNLTYPPDPASFESSTIGGNIAHGAGGPKAIKYGTTRDYVLNLEVVTGKGDIIWTGANTLKNSTGFALTHLMIGSEGLLGIVTKAVLKLVPKVENELLLLAAFRDSYSAASCVNQILLAGFCPVGIELMELEAVKISMEATKLTFPIPADVQYYLLIILEGQNVSELELQSENIYEIISNFGAFEVYTPSNSDMANEWWKIRRSMGTAVKQISVYKEEDTVVPRGNLPQLLSGVKEIGQKYNFRSVCYGHAGDGNLHINILKDNLSQQQWTEEIPIAIREIFELCKSLGGTISGEHGIGLVQKPYLDIVISPEVMSIFQGIKNSFDPNRILNMGKWIG